MEIAEEVEDAAAGTLAASDVALVEVLLRLETLETATRPEAAAETGADRLRD
jgi:hypothetical protein